MGEQEVLTISTEPRLATPIADDGIFPLKDDRTRAHLWKDRHKARRGKFYNRSLGRATLILNPSIS